MPDPLVDGLQSAPVHVSQQQNDNRTRQNWQGSHKVLRRHVLKYCAGQKHKWLQNLSCPHSNCACCPIKQGCRSFPHQFTTPQLVLAQPNQAALVMRTQSQGEAPAVRLHTKHRQPN
jgi:hypothetical protein